MGADFFDPLYQDAWSTIFRTAPSTLGWFIVGLILAAAVAKAPRVSAIPLGVGLVLSEVIVRSEYCRLAIPDAGDVYRCGHLGSALALAAALLLIRIVAGRIMRPFGRA